MNRPFLIALDQLSLADYEVFLPIFSTTNLLILSDAVGSILSRCFFKGVSSTPTTPIVSLTQPQALSLANEEIDHMLCCNADDKTTWLIPITEITNPTKTIRLGKKFERYIVKPRTIAENKSLKALCEQKLQEMESFQLEIEHEYRE